MVRAMNRVSTHSGREGECDAGLSSAVHDHLAFGVPSI